MIAFRRSHEKIIEHISVTPFQSKWGPFMLHTYRNILDNTEHLAVVVGDISNADETFVRVHVENTIQDILSADASVLDQSMKQNLRKGQWSLGIDP